MSDYLVECILKNAKRLAYLRKNDLPQDDNLFWRTVGFYGDVYGDSKDDAVKYLTRLVNHIIKEGVVQCIRPRTVFRKIGSHLIATAVFCIRIIQRII